MTRVVQLTKTCGACPTQWEGKLEDGRMIYFRYRSGRCTLDVSESPTNDIDDAVMGFEVHNHKAADEWDGCMSDSEVMDIIGRYFDVTDFISGPYSMGPGH